jgi:hypothetical protein
MSIDRCKHCHDLVDTDDDPDAYQAGDFCVCEACREEHYVWCCNCGVLVTDEPVTPNELFTFCPRCRE